MTTQPDTDKSPNSPTEPWSCCNGHAEFENKQYKCKYCNTTYDDYLRNNPIPDYGTHQLSYQQLTKQLEKSKQELLELYSENDALNEQIFLLNKNIQYQREQFEQELSRKSMRVEALMTAIIVNYLFVAFIIFCAFFEISQISLGFILFSFLLSLLFTINHIKYYW